jgi:hypothetical protein
MLTVFVVLVIVALVFLSAHVLRSDRVPLWPAVGVLWFIELVRILPLGKN